MKYNTKQPVLGVHLGEACGIGPEIIAKICASGTLNNLCNPVIVGDEKVLELGMKSAGVSFDYDVIEKISDAHFDEGRVYLINKGSIDEKDIILGECVEGSGKVTGDNLMHLLESCKAGELEGFVFAPFNKVSLKMGGYKVESENKLFAKYFQCEDHVSEMNVIGDIWTARVTSHVPVKDVDKYLTVDSIYGAIQQAYKTLVTAGYKEPRIGVSALNPHAGEHGTCGREEIDIIEPAVAKARAAGINIEGPISADIIFIRALQKKQYDAVVTMYHDQGQIALKLVGFDSGVTVHAGLPVAITTPAHGSAFDIAGRGIAMTTATENAFKMASKMAKGYRK